MGTFAIASFLVSYVAAYMALTIPKCPSNCECSASTYKCTIQNTTDMLHTNNVMVDSLYIMIPITPEELAMIVWKLPKVKSVSIVSDGGDDVAQLSLLLRNSSATNIQVIKPEQETCRFSKTKRRGRLCFCQNEDQVNLIPKLEGDLCICKRCYNATDENLVVDVDGNVINNQSNVTNGTTGLNPGSKVFSRHEQSTQYSIILGVFSIIALIINVLILARMCTCKHQSVSKIFGMSLMLFNVLLAEYGIALAIYLTQEDGRWVRSFCQAITAVKLFSMFAVILSLVCLTWQSSINPPDDNYNSQDVRFKAVVYILEVSVLSAMVCILSWTKFDDWDFSCQIVEANTTADKILLAIEYCYHSALFLLVLRYPYKTLRQKEPPPSYIKMKDVVEREHPIFIMVLCTFLIWSLPFIVTIPQLNVTGQFVTPVIRNSSLMLGAIILPILLVIRNSRICCSRHKACGVNDPHVCQCKGRSTNMCYACEVQHQEMISRCEKQSFGDRRKSLSLDDLKYVLGVYKQEPQCSLKVQRRKLISRSFPVINMDTIEEAELEDVADIDRLFPPGKGKCFDYSLESAAKTRKPLSRESSFSLPLLPSPRKCMPIRKKVPLHAKLSLSPRKSVLPSPVRKSLQKKRAASLDTSKVDRSVHSPESGRSSVSSPSRSGDESRKISTEKKKNKKKRGSLSKSKDSVKSKDSSSGKSSKEKLQVSNNSSGSTTPNRESRVPSFIPLADAESSNKKSPAKPTAPTVTGKTKELKGAANQANETTKEDEALLGEEPDRVPSRGPTFFFVEDADQDDQDDIYDDVRRPLVDKEKKETEKKPRRKGKRKKSSQSCQEGTPAHESAPLGSLHSLEWDPSFSLSDSSCSSPIDEYVPPSPAPPPSVFALQKVKELGAVAPDSPQASIGRSSNYSMDWDPTGVQMRHSLVSPCDWEPYGVEEAISNPTSPELADLEKFRASMNGRDRQYLPSPGDKRALGKAPLATEEV